MKRPGFSLSTLILVGILLGAVVFVGSMVNPIAKPAEQEASHDDHGHEGGETKQAAASDPNKLPESGNEPGAKANSKERAEFSKKEADMRRTMYKKIAETAKLKAEGKVESKTPLTDPTAIDPTPTHFFNEDMG